MTTLKVGLFRDGESIIVLETTVFQYFIFLIKLQHPNQV